MTATPTGPERPVTFPNGRGQRLAGVLHGEPGPQMGICCHGMLSCKDGPKHVWLARELAREGLPTLRFDFAGRGESEGSLFDLSYTHEVEDLQAAVDFLVGLGAERFGLFGSSMGGSVALLCAARDERIAAVATLAAVAHPALVCERHPDAAASWRERGYVDTDAGRIGRGLLDDALTRDVVAAVAMLRAPLLVVHGDRDDVVPSSDAHDIAAAARHVSLNIVAEADHAFSSPTQQRLVMRSISEFLARQLAASLKTES